MNRVEFKVVVANQSEAMESRDHFKNGAGLKSQMIKANILVVVCFALLAVLSGCNKEKRVDFVDGQLIGKWELKYIRVTTVSSSGSNSYTSHVLPYNGINSGGYEFTKTAMKYYKNQNLESTIDASTDATRIFEYESGVNTNIGTWLLSDNTVSIRLNNSPNSTFYCEKVSKFSWE